MKEVGNKFTDPPLHKDVIDKKSTDENATLTNTPPLQGIVRFLFL